MRSNVVSKLGRGLDYRGIGRLSRGVIDGFLFEMVLIVVWRVN